MFISDISTKQAAPLYSCAGTYCMSSLLVGVCQLLEQSAEIPHSDFGYVSGKHLIFPGRQ